jgi:Helix-turn-helix domain
MVEDDPLYPAEETARELNVAQTTLATWRCIGRGPRYVKVGRAVYYRRSAICAWLKAQERDPSKKRAA